MSVDFAFSGLGALTDAGPQTYPAGRRCPDCGCVLSSYTPGPRCSRHAASRALARALADGLRHDDETEARERPYRQRKPRPSSGQKHPPVAASEATAALLELLRAGPVASSVIRARFGMGPLLALTSRGLAESPDSGKGNVDRRFQLTAAGLKWTADDARRAQRKAWRPTTKMRAEAPAPLRALLEDIGPDGEVSSARLRERHTMGTLISAGSRGLIQSYGAGGSKGPRIISLTINGREMLAAWRQS